jgi:hypothetical protein
MHFSPGFEFIRLKRRTKIPKESNWNNSDPNKPPVPSLTPDEVREILRQGGNYGVRLRTCDLVIDIDPRNGGSPSVLPFDYTAFPIVRTPSGGDHIYCTLPPGIDPDRIPNSIKEFGKGIEFKTKGRQVVGPGSIHPDYPNGPRYIWDTTFGEPIFPAPVAPDSLVEKILKPEPVSIEDATAQGLMTNEQLEFVLARLDVEKFADHDDWFALMCACHEATAGEGRAAFINWSTSDVQYADHAENIALRWDSLTVGKGGGAGTGTLLHILIEHGVTDLNLDRNPEADFADVANQDYQPPSGNRPTIRVRGDSLPQNFEAIEKAIGLQTSAKPDLGIYQRGGMLVRIVRYAGDISTPDEEGISRANGALQILSAEGVLQMYATKAAEWLKYDARTKEWRHINAPAEVIQTLASGSGLWPTIPNLYGICESPILRLDGTVLDAPGYDAKSGIFFDAKISFDPIPQHPTFEDASRALDELLEINKGFPFVSEECRSVALAMQLTPFARHAMRAAPMFIVSAPKPGSGKTLMSNVPNYLTAGKASSLFSQADNPEEDKKRLLALLLEGSLVTVIDNVEKPLKSDALCTALTEPSIKDRILGSTKVISVPTKTVWIATGNNVRVDGDLSSRCLLCRIDAKIERPEERSFNVNLHEYIPRNRGRLASACLTILRAYICSGERVSCPTYGRFEQWSQFVREPLLWLGLDDPCDTRQMIEANDPVRGTLGNLLAAWHRHYGSTPMTVAKVLLDVQSDLESKRGDLDAAITEIAGERGRINAQRLGSFIARYEDRIERGLRFERFETNRDGAMWRVVR